jgi:hypothetical protein
VETLLRSEDCNCFAVRSALGTLDSFYDQFLAPIGLRTTQFSFGEAQKTGTVDHPRTCKGHGHSSHNTRAQHPAAGAEWVNPDPAGRIRPSGQGAAADQGGGKRLAAALMGWAAAQARFEGAYGTKRAADLNGLLRAVVASECAP